MGDQGAADASSTCPICLVSIGPEQDETFLDTCMHSYCYSCISKWTETQSATTYPPPSAFKCPLCKRPYQSLIHDCRGPTDFVRQWVVDQAARKGAAHAASFAPERLQLTVAHRRRRGIYASPLDAAEQASVRSAVITPQLAARPDVARWVERELQALMQQQDVVLVAAHMTGTLRAAVQAPPAAAASSAAAAAGRGTAGSSRPGSRQAMRPGCVLQAGRLALRPGAAARGAAAKPAGVPVAEAASKLEAAAQPFLFEHAQRFAWELCAFCASGRTIAAHDQHEMQVGSAAAAKAVAEARRQLARRQQWWLESSSVPQRQAAQAIGAAAAAAAASPGATDSSSISGGEEADGGVDSSPAASSGRSHEAQRSDSEGYLELLVAQSRFRHSQEQRQQQQGAEASSRQQEDGGEQPGGSSRDQHRKSKRRKPDHSPYAPEGGADDSEQGGTDSSTAAAAVVGANASEGAAQQRSVEAGEGDLAALRQEALQALQRHRRASDADNVPDCS